MRNPHPQEEFSISYEYEGKAKKKDPEALAMENGRKLMQSEDLIGSDAISSLMKNSSGIVDRRNLIGVKSGFTATYKTETTDTTATTAQTKDSDFTTSTFFVNCQCPTGVIDEYCTFENHYSSQVSWSNSRWSGES